MQGLIQERDEKHIDQDQSCKASDQYCYKTGLIALLIHHFRYAQPLTGCSGKYAFKEQVINEEHAKEKPAETVIVEMVIHRVPLIDLGSNIADEEYYGRICQKIQDPGTRSYFIHAANLPHQIDFASMKYYFCDKIEFHAFDR